jgi:3-hydroxyacyl-[acyl-carrier-protein] dehydratase
MSQHLTRQQIEHYIPHRAPILLVDEITAWEANKSIEGKRVFKKDDPLFEGHFPGNPVLPGVLIIEAMAQTAAVLTSLSLGLNATTVLYLFAGIKNVRMLNPVLPGNTLVLHAEKIRDKLGIHYFSGRAYVGDVLVAEADFTAKLVRK